MTPYPFFPIHNSPFSWMICLKPYEGLECAQVPHGMHLKNRQVPAFVSRISLQNLVKQWSKHNFYQGTAVRFSWMRWFFQSHVEFYRMSKIAGLELPTRNALKTDQTSIFSDPFASVLLPYIFSSHVGFEYLQLPLGMHQKIVKFGFCVYSWLANLSNFHGSIFPEWNVLRSCKVRMCTIVSLNASKFGQILVFCLI